MRNRLHRRLRFAYRAFGAVLLSLCFGSVHADELIFNVGGGPQYGSDVSGSSSRQTNHTIGVDYNFYRYARSPRSSFVIGASYTYLGTNTDDHESVHALSVYPQLSMYPSETSWVNRLIPGNGQPFFYVRALGPTYLSSNQLGSRRQAKHFSNANLFDDNDGFDLPVVLTVGVTF